jgi:hypothetical protein
MSRAVSSIVLLLVLGLGAFLTSHAQLTGSEPLTVSIQPSYPRPYDTVTIIPESSAFDLSTAQITVTVSGSVVNRTSGSEPTYITVGGPGSVANITVTAVTARGNYSKAISVRPADVALIVEPTSSIHPFYEGASLVATQGTVRLIAVPDLRTSGGAVIAPQNLVYTWRFGEQVLQSSSGIGKSVLTASAPPKYRDASVSVTVSTQDQTVVAQASAVISPADPSVRIYKSDPLLGPLFNAALPKSVALSDDEETLRAVPYYFASDPSIAWRVNGQSGDSGKTITVRPTGSGSGKALLSANAQSGNPVQSARADISVSFGEQRSFGLFGL